MRRSRKQRGPLERGWTTCLGLCLIAACSGSTDSVAARPNVILICMDTVRADHVGCYGYEARATTPTLDALAKDSTVFTDTSATAGWTKPSVPSFLTSTYPLQHGAYLGDSKGRLDNQTDMLPEKALTLAEVFSEGGYQTAAFVKNAQLRSGLGFEQGFDSYEDKPGDAREIRWRAQDWLRERDSEAPFFLYLHFLDAHWPYPVPPEYAFKFVSGDSAERFRRSDWRDLRKSVNSGETTLLDEEVGALVALYDGAIRYIDDQLQQLLSGLEDSGLAEDTIICVISDHGEEFLEHGKIGHGHGLYENLLQVPWILHVPGRPGRVVEDPCSLVDLMPTLAGVVGLPVGGAAMGVDLMGQVPTDRTIFAEHLSETTYLQTFRQHDQKLLVEMKPGAGLKPSEREAELDRGVRWKAEFASDGSPRVALVLEPELADDVMEPTEIKAMVKNLKGSQFDLCGVPVVLGRGTTFYGEGATSHTISDLNEGRLAKAKGRISDDGVFIPEKLKLYGRDAEIELEVRGRLLAIEPDGRVNLGGVWIQTNDDTQIARREGDRKPRLSRDLLVELFLQDGDFSQDDRISIGAELYKLGLDPLELNGQAVEGTKNWSGEFDLVRALARTRFWGSGDQMSLTTEDLEALRAIGYAD